MQTGIPADTPPDSRAVSAGGALGALRAAFAALLTGARRTGLAPGAVESPRISTEARAGWVAGLTEALAEVPVLVVGCGPGALTYGDIPILEGSVAPRLHGAGVQGLLVFRGATEEELLALARVLLTAWPASDGSAADVESALWGLALAHVHVQLASRGAEADQRGVGRLRAADTGTLVSPTVNPTDELLSASALAHLSSERERLAALPAPRGREGQTLGQPRPIHPELTAAALAARNLGDLDHDAVTATVTELLAHADADVAARTASLALRYVLDTLGDAASPAPVIHAVLERIDNELGADGPGRAAVRAAARALAEDPLRARVARVAYELREADFRGELFSLFSLLVEADTVTRIIEGLPPWAARVLADAVLAAESDGVPSVDLVRKRLHATRAADILLGLCMAARSEDPRLIEPVLLHVDHVDAGVRAAALYALRNQRSPRVRDVVRARLTDPSEPVRLEALRYCVAYKDTEVVPRIEQRLLDPATASATDAEVRALFIALARIQRAEGPLLDFAIGSRRGAHASTPRHALAGLKALGTPRARAAIERVAAEVPRMRAEALSLLAEDR